MAKRGTSLSSREDFLIEQLPIMKKVNTMMSRLFEVYYIDCQPHAQLSNMMLTVLPKFYVDPLDPEYPSEYTIVGKSLVPYMERVVFITPYVDGKSKYQYDLSAYRGLAINAMEFQVKARMFRKTKIEPYVVMGEQQDGTRCAQSVIIKEPGMKKSETLNIPSLILPSKQRYGIEANRAMVDKLIYSAYYQYIFDYLQDPSLIFTPIESEVIRGLKEEYMYEYTVPTTGDVITMSKDLIPNPTDDHTYSLAYVENGHVVAGSGKRHYLLAEDYESAEGQKYMTVYTLFAILSMAPDA